ncbi:hypothetical protein B005_1499 [Nocardiopsis alba ATCC BAA-2165]|uniref:Uncharacterized protein n=1 Tax=Nocardiopsis alba (strain ATCC BAA-2165 / BE74) TaxID=1205910 RepID=J7L4Y0_NOCAA|nr:hypothetical protein B005_1499 [Nocardiopsis alba ATCC BAA-2165]
MALTRDSGRFRLLPDLRKEGCSVLLWSHWQWVVSRVEGKSPWTRVASHIRAGRIRFGIYGGSGLSRADRGRSVFQVCDALVRGKRLVLTA